LRCQIGQKEFETRMLFSEQAIAARVAVLAREIEAAIPPGEELLVLVVLDGAFIFAADLIRQIDRTTRVESIQLKSYSGMHSTGVVEMVKGLPDDLAGKHVLIVEDIVDTGRTIAHLAKELKGCNAASCRIAVLLDKPDAHLCSVPLDFVGFSIGKNFVIGYGLDADGRYRNLPYIAEVLTGGAPE
jgi:hypoxanthine phosphoribosyltransferase